MPRGISKSRLADNLGKHFGNLEVIGQPESGKGLIARCNGLDADGNVCGKLVTGSATQFAWMESCGCQRTARPKEKHGNCPKSGCSPEYSSWYSMKARCDNPNHKHYTDYGGRGIKVTERWDLFSNFLEDMGKKPSPKHSIDRFPDQNGNYEKDNCRWATQFEQRQNIRNNVLLTLNGETLCAAEWSRRTGVPTTTIYKRKLRGETDVEILTPYELPKVTLSGISLTMDEWEVRLGMTRDAIKARIRYGYSDDEVINGRVETSDPEIVKDRQARKAEKRLAIKPKKEPKP